MQAFALFLFGFWNALFTPRLFLGIPIILHDRMTQSEDEFYAYYVDNYARLFKSHGAPQHVLDEIVESPHEFAFILAWNLCQPLWWWIPWRVEAALRLRVVITRLSLAGKIPHRKSKS